VEQAEAITPVAEARPAYGDRPRRDDAPQPRASRDESRPSRDEPRQYREPRDDGPKVVGFGADMPAFLRQSVSAPSVKAVAEKPVAAKKPARAPRKKPVVAVQA